MLYLSLCWVAACICVFVCICQFYAFCSFHQKRGKFCNASRTHWLGHNVLLSLFHCLYSISTQWLHWCPQGSTDPLYSFSCHTPACTWGLLCLLSNLHSSGWGGLLSLLLKALAWQCPSRDGVASIISTLQMPGGLTHLEWDSMVWFLLVAFTINIGQSYVGFYSTSVILRI